eukprot:6299086-Ditylum_brightwellii.AAC.1
MPICGIYRSIHPNNEARKQSCLREHLTQTDVRHPLACITSDSFSKTKQLPPRFQVSFCSKFPIATGDNNDSKDNDAYSIQDDDETTTPRAIKGKTLPVVENIYNKKNTATKETREKN